MDPFQALPVPILESILGFLPDLSALFYIYNASPTVASVLRLEGVAPLVIEIIMVRSSMPRETHVLIRTVALLRWGSSFGFENTVCEYPLPSSLAAFQRSYEQNVSSSPKKYGEKHLPRSTPPFILCRLLALYTHVHCPTHYYLHDLIAHCLTLKPERVAHPRLRYKLRGTLEKMQKRPEGLPVQPVNIGAPSWIEEQRVLRAMWRMVLFFELRYAISINGCGWAEEDIQLLQGMNLENFWEKFLSVGGKEEMMSVAEWVFSADAALVVPVAKGRYGPLPPWMISPSPLSKMSIHCCKLSRPVTGEEWSQEDWDLCGESRSSRLFGLVQRHWPSPLRYVDLSVFRPYAFAIWDEDRLEALGFWVLNRSGTSESDVLFRWLNILLKEQLEEVQKTQRINWEIEMERYRIVA